VLAAVAAAGGGSDYRPVYALTETGPARRRAQAQALAVARADAEAYAAAHQLRITRIVRITERVGFAGFSLIRSRDGEFRPRHGDPIGGQTVPEVDTRVFVGVDFALAPR